MKRGVFGLVDLVGLACGVGLLASVAGVAAYPEKPVTFIVGFPAGRGQ